MLDIGSRGVRWGIPLDRGFGLPALEMTGRWEGPSVGGFGARLRAAIMGRS
jgi:hypothetical protein